MLLIYSLILATLTPSPSRAFDLEEARKSLVQSEASLKKALEEWKQASARLRQMANCEYNDNREKDLAEMAERNQAVKVAEAKLTASLRKIEKEGARIFAAPIAANACDKGPAELKARMLEYRSLVARELEQNFPEGKPSTIEIVARKSTPSLHAAMRKYQGWNCHQPKGMFDIVGKEACRRYRSCSRGADPQVIYHSVLQYMEKSKAAWIGAGKKQGAYDVKSNLGRLGDSAALKAESLGALAGRCSSADAVAVAEKKVPATPAVKAGDRAPAAVAALPPKSSLKEPGKAEQGSGSVVGDLIRESKAGARVTGEVPARAEAPSPWAAPDWHAYDRYKESIHAPNIVRGVDLNSEYAGFLASNQIQVRSLDDALRLQRAINATSMEVNGADSIGPSVYQDGIVGSRTKSAVYLMQSDSAYREVFLRALRREGLAT